MGNKHTKATSAPNKAKVTPSSIVKHDLFAEKECDIAESNHVPSMVESLPVELLFLIVGWLSPKDLPAWCLTCRTFYSVCDKEHLYRAYCFSRWPILFSLGLNPFFSPHSYNPNGSTSGCPFTWQQRYEFAQLHPRRLRSGQPSPSSFFKKFSPRQVDESGLVHTNTDSYDHGPYNNIPAERCFITTLPSAAINQIAPQVNPEDVRFKGLDYFEAKIIRNTAQWNKAQCIAVSHEFVSLRFLGWDANSVAYHSDDGTIRTESVAKDGRIFGTGDVIGCGMDWQRNDIFFTVNGDLLPSTVPINMKVPWFPAVGSMIRGDSMRVNFGAEPFLFDLSGYEEKRKEIQDTSAGSGTAI